MTIPFTLTNTGSLPADFELKEMNNGSFTNMASPQKGQGKWLYQATTGIPMQSNQGKTTLAYPKAYRWTPDVVSPVQALIYADDRIHSSPDTYLDQALQALGVNYTAHYDGDFSGFEADLAKGGWDVVLYEGENYWTPETTLTALNDWVQSGGHLGVEIGYVV